MSFVLYFEDYACLCIRNCVSICNYDYDYELIIMICKVDEPMFC